MLKICLTFIKIKRHKMKLPVVCLVVNHYIVSQMKCTNCDTTVNGNYELPLYLQLGREEQQFILIFSIQRKYKNEQTG